MVKIETFRDVCSVKKSIFLTFVTSAGLADNAQRNMVQSEVTLDDFHKFCGMKMGRDGLFRMI